MTAIWRRMYFSMITFVLFLIYARPTQIRSAVDGFRVNYKIASSITLCSVRPCVCVCVHFYRRFPVSASRFGNFLAVNYLKFLPVFLSFRKRCKSRRPRKNRYQRPAFATRSSPVRSSCRVVGLSAFSGARKSNHEEVPEDPATVQRRQRELGGRRQDAERRAVSIFIHTHGLWHSWGRSCCTVVFVVLSRADNRTAVKPDQTFAKVEITVKDRDESVSMAHVDASQYKKLIIEDLTSTGKRTSGDTRSAGPRRASRQNPTTF